MSETVDLGKAQQHLRMCEAHVKSAQTKLASAKAKVEHARAVWDATHRHAEEAKVILDKAKQAVIEGARTIAQG